MRDVSGVVERGPRRLFAGAPSRPLRDLRGQAARRRERNRARLGNAPFGMGEDLMDYNLLALLQAAQGAQHSPTMAGPVAPQSPTPGFRMPTPMSVSPPQLSQPNQGLDLS